MTKALALAVTLFTAACHGQASRHPVAGAPALKDLPRDGMYFDCDSAADASSQWSQAVDASSGTAHGSLVFEATRESYWTPGAYVNVASADGRSNAGIWITVQDEHLAARVQYLLPSMKGHARMQLNLRPLPLSGMFFEVAWAPNLVRVRAERGAPWIDIAVGFTPARFWLTCTSAEVVFYSVTATAATPAATPGSVSPGS